MPLFGQLALWLALLLAVWGVVTGFGGARLERPDLQESARRATVMTAATLGSAVISLALAAWRQDFHLVYVAAHADRTLSARDVWAVVLDGWAGRWLVSGFALAAGLAGARTSATRLDAGALAYTSGLGSAVLAVIVMVLLSAGRPFDLQSYTPLDGQGLSQSLYDLDARVATLVRCLAYAATGVAAAWLTAGALARQRDAHWSSWTRAWAVVAWVLLTADLSWSWWSGLQDNQLSVVVRPALLLWIVLTALVHVRWAPAGVAAYLTHLGALLVAAGLLVAPFRTYERVDLRPGESASVAGFSIRYLASSVYPAGNQIITQGLVEVGRGPRSLGRVATVRRQQFDVFGKERGVPVVRAGSWHGLVASVFIRWQGESANGERNQVDVDAFDVVVAPLAPGLLLGCWLLGLGGLAALWPARSRT